jgi:hypothetical protein
MTDCANCGRTLASTESKYSTKVRTKPGNAVETWCADCITKYNPLINEN